MANDTYTTMYVQDSTPGATGEGLIWIDTSEKYFKVYKTGWKKLFKYNMESGGYITEGGGNLLGAISITGVTGSSEMCQPLASPSFTGQMTLNGDDVMTIDDLALSIDNLEEVNTPATPVVPTVSTNQFAVATGIIAARSDFTYDLNPYLPTFADGVVATAGECSSMVSYLGGEVVMGDPNSNPRYTWFTRQFSMFRTGTHIFNCKVIVSIWDTGQSWPQGYNTPCRIGYIILAKRA